MQKTAKNGLRSPSETISRYSTNLGTSQFKKGSKKEKPELKKHNMEARNMISGEALKIRYHYDSQGITLIQ